MRLSKPNVIPASIVYFGIKEVGPHYWVGRCNNGTEYYAGQSFKIPVSGILNNIKLFDSHIHGLPEATLCIYAFDAIHHTWKEKKAECKISITPSMENQWIAFVFSPLIVSKNEYYGFKLECCGGGMMAIAECPWNNCNPYADGKEWIGSSLGVNGKFQEDFDFAFEGEIDVLGYTQFF